VKASRRAAGHRLKSAGRPVRAATVRPVGRWRFWAVNLVGLAMGGVLVARIAALQVLPNQPQGAEFLQDQGQVRTLRERVIPAYRGIITDRHGAPLAISTQMYSLWVEPAAVEEAQLPQLAELAGLGVSELRARLQNYAGRQFMYVRRGMTPAQAEAALAAGIRGLGAESEYQRFYPEKEVTAQVVGLTDIDDRGIEGLELGYEQSLRGTAGRRRVLQDLRGQVVKDLGLVRAVEPGADLALTLDLRIQYLGYRALKAAVARHRARAASMVVMNPRSGEVLALVSQPSFNPNVRAQFSPLAMRNRAVVDSFEPGSVVKPFTLLAAMEQGALTPDTRIDTAPGYLDVQGKRIEDPRNHGALSVREILALSSQVGTVKVALRTAPEQVHGVFQRVGLGRPPGSGFPGEQGGSLPERGRWDDLQRATFAFGYGLTASALQLARAYAVLANGGHLVHPALVKGVAAARPAVVVDRALARQVREMMVAVVEQGTGARARIDGYPVAGKTGTGHLVGAGGYEDSRYAALFAGMVPAHDPALVAVVVVIDPQAGGYSGGRVAAPVFAEVMGEAMRILQVAPLPSVAQVSP